MNTPPLQGVPVRYPLFEMPEHSKNRHVRTRSLVSAAAALAVLPVAGIYGCRALAKIDYATEPADTALAPLIDAAPESPAAALAPVAVVEIEYVARESGVLVGQLSESGSLAADAFWPTEDRDDNFLVQDAGEDDPVAVVRTIRHSSDGSLEIIRAPRADTATGETSESDSGGVASRTILARTDSGDVVITFNAANKIESSFDPASLFLPAVLSTGDSIKRPFTVDAKGPRFGTGIGEGSITVRGLGMQPVRTPAGDFAAFVMESESSFQIGPAKIKRTRHAWFVPGADARDGLGIVAEESSQTVKVFGISFSNKAWVSVLSGDDGTAAIP